MTLEEENMGDLKEICVMNLDEIQAKPRWRMVEKLAHIG
jgi:hypothetical protein